MRLNLFGSRPGAAPLFALLGLIAVGCEVGPDYKTPHPPMPENYSELNAATQPTTRGSATEPSAIVIRRMDYQRWWTTFHDPLLEAMIRRAIAGNPNLAAAEARIREARQTIGTITPQLYPQVNADGSYTHSRASANEPFAGEVLSGTSGGTSSGSSLGSAAFAPSLVADIWQAGFDASWEIDVFGGTRRAIESAKASLQAANWDKRDVLVSLCAEVAVNYIELRGAQLELQLAEQNLQSQQQTLSLTRTRAEGGLDPYLDVTQQEATVATTAATIPTLQAQIRQYVHHLAVLTGRSPGALAGELELATKIPIGPPALPPGLPSELLRRRPDIRRAERQLAAATAQIGVATADLFPKFSITGAMGTESGIFRQLFSYSSRFYDIAPGVTWDIFDAGLVQSEIGVRNAQQAEALAAYRQTVLQAMQDVDDALIAYNREQVRLRSLTEAVVANQKSVDLSMDLFQKGSRDFLSVLDAERDLFAAQNAEALSEQAVSVDLVALYKALGGGWE